MEAPSRPVLVALGSEARSLRLIQAAFRLARELGAPWTAVHVEVGHGAPTEDLEQIQVWAQEAQRLGAAFHTVRASTLAQGLTDCVNACQARALVLGRSGRRWPWARLGHATADELQRRGLPARLVILDDRPEVDPGGATVQAGPLVGTLAILAACTGLAWVLPRQGGLPLVLPVYLLGVTLVAHRWGQGLGSIATVLSLFLYDFLGGTPHFRPAAEGWPDLLFFLGLLLAAQMGVALVRRLRLQAEEVRRREIHTASLYLLGRALAQDRTPEDVARTSREHLQRVFKVKAWLLFPDGDRWAAHPDALDAELPPPAELLPRLDVGARVGDPLEPLPVEAGYCLSLSGTDGSEGVLRVLPLTATGLPWETWELLKAFAVQIALALERIRWLEAARKAELDIETERLRNTFLGAISHDLRTPLAAIQGAASSLLLPGGLPEQDRHDLLAMIQDESERLAHLLGNILDLTRLESGTLHLQKEWQPLEEVVGSALARFERHGGRTPVQVHLPPDLPLVPLDAALMEQALLNLLTNAQRHAPQAATELRAWTEPGWAWLEVADRGPGIPEPYRERIFDKFFRLPDALAGGVGLGLAICRAIVQAHGGTIRADPRPGGGTAFRLALPRPDPPPLPPGEPA